MMRNKKMMRNGQKEREAKIFSELMNQLHYTHKCEHLIFKREEHSIYYSRNSNIFFLLDYSCANIPIS